MDNQKYERVNQINEYAGYLKSGAGGILAISLLQGNDVLAGISVGLCLVGDIINRISQRQLNAHLQSGLENTLKE